MSYLFDNHSYLSTVLKHKKLPVYKTREFDFFRCVNFGEEWVYGKSVTELHNGNLRSNDNKGRFSRLFPNEKISYWADSKATALAEIKKHGGNKNYLTFWAYDDVSSFIPIMNNNEELIIIDGRDFNFHTILEKVEKNEDLTQEEKEIIIKIEEERPDCLAYKSVAAKQGVNFLFFEKGFKKLALREIKIYHGERKNKNSAQITCAYTSDYTPFVENYGNYFNPIAKVIINPEYQQTEEYKSRYLCYMNNLEKNRKSR